MIRLFANSLLKVDGNWVTIDGHHVFIPTNKFNNIQAQNKGMKDEDIHRVIATDPSPNKEYSYWIARQATKGTINLPEDSEKISEQLKQFTQLKNSPVFTGERDIGKHTPGSLYQTLEQYGKQKSKSELSKDYGRLIYDSGPYKIFKIDPKELGIGEAVRTLQNASSSTNWCTTQERYARGYLEKGPTFIMFYNGKKYAQLHPQSEQYMNTSDSSLIR